MKHYNQGSFLFIAWCKTDFMFWLRVFGIGFLIVDRGKQKPLFSVRNGSTKEYRIGRYGFQWLGRVEK